MSSTPHGLRSRHPLVSLSRPARSSQAAPRRVDAPGVGPEVPGGRAPLGARAG